MNVRRLLVLGCVALASTAALVQQQILSPSEYQRVVAWFRCIDCRDGERDSVRNLATLKPIATVDTLTRALFFGPDSAVRLQLRRSLGRIYDRDTAYVRAESLSRRYPPRDTFVNRRVASFDATWRVRAAEVLGYINASRSDSVLDSAIILLSPPNPPLHPRVLRMVRYARDSLP